MTKPEPVFVTALREACDRQSQALVAKRIGYSPAVVNQVLAGKYKGDLNRVQRAIEGALLGVTVDCPILGPLASNKCLDLQSLPFAATNPQRVKLYKACRKCEHNRTGK